MEELTLDLLVPTLQSHYQLAKTGFSQGCFTYAIEICRSILKIYPGCAEVRTLMYKAKKKSYQQKSFIKKLLGLSKYPFYALKSWILLKKSTKQAIQSAEYALESYPNSKFILKLFAKIAKRLKLNNTLVFAYEQLHTLAPKDGKMAIALGYSYITANEQKKAIELGERLVDQGIAIAEAMTLVQRASVEYTLRKGVWLKF